MKQNKFLFIITILLALNSYSQIKFEKGYFIEKSGAKTACYIKNIDWENNPSKLEYKTALEDEKKTISILRIKEFSIYNYSKYIRKKIKIDTSGSIISELSQKRGPEWKEEIIILEVLLEGKASLYKYSSKKLERYFYKTENSDIQQLVYKKYKVGDLSIKTNNSFKQQLSSYVKCESTALHVIQNLEFYKNTLIDYFVKYNKCSDSNFDNFEEKKNRDIFHLTIKPGIDYTSFTANNSRLNISNVTFDREFYARLAVELEYKLPFRKNKWSLIVEPSYTYLISDEGITRIGNNTNRADISFQSIELAIGFRRYFFLNNNTSFFANTAAVVAVSPNATLSTVNRNIDIDSRFNYSTFTLGIGFAYKKWNTELRYHVPKTIFKLDEDWNSSLNKTSLIIGYQIF